jgi:hypothetical protein
VDCPSGTCGEEALREADAAVVNFHHRLPMAGAWAVARRSSWCPTGRRLRDAHDGRSWSILCQHWGIESLHWLRDTVYREDNFIVHARSGPRVMAALRNLAIGAICLTGRRVTVPGGAMLFYGNSVGNQISGNILRRVS